MKLCFFITLFFIAMVAARRPPVKCPNRDRGNAVLLADPRSCSSFYVCTNGVPVKQNCPAGLRFNARLRVCDWPRNVHCRGGRSFTDELFGGDEETTSE